VSLTRDDFVAVFRRILIAGAFAIGLAILASFLVARRLVLPIRRVADATTKLANGDMTHRVPVEGDGEVAELASGFNSMADSLVEARRREREFLASVSHELRTPLTAIRGYAEAISDGTAVGQKKEDALGVIQGEADRLERLVEDVMDLARLGAGDLRLDLGEVDLAGTIEDAVTAHGPMADDAGVELLSEVPEDLVVNTDSGRVRQIISNLVENALRVTPAGGRVLVAGIRDTGTVTIAVSDTGPGISADDLPHVFERSYLWSHSRGVREVGTGLGLAIVRELAETLGGRVEAESDGMSGSNFRLHLPA
jgi:two-component system sensor histidine kinase BaeS